MIPPANSGKTPKSTLLVVLVVLAPPTFPSRLGRMAMAATVRQVVANDNRNSMVRFNLMSTGIQK